MGRYIGPTFESFNQGLKIYGFETQDVDIVFTINSSSFSIITSGTCTYNVYWGDGTNETVNASGTYTKSHSYSSSGIYNVGIDVVSGTFRPYYNDNSEGDKITRIRGKYNSIFDGSFQNAFYGSANLEEFTVDLSGVTSLYSAFLSCSNLDYFNNNAASNVMQRPLFNFRDFSNVTYIGGAFADTGSLVFNGFNLSGLSGNQYYSSGSYNSLTYYGPFSRTLYYYNYYSGSTEASNVVSIGSLTNPIGFGTTGGNTFGLQFFASGCTSLNQVYFDSGVKITSLQYAFTGATGLDTFEVLDKDLSNCTNIGGAFANTGSLVFNGFNLSGLSGNQFYQKSYSTTLSFYGPFSRTLYYYNGYSGSSEASNVVSIGSSTNPIGFGTTGGNTFGLQFFASGCTSLNQVYFDSGVKITSLKHAFTRATGLDTFEVLDKDLSNCTNIGGAFANTGSLVFNGFNLSGLSGNQYYKGSTTSSANLNYYGPFSRARTPSSIDNYSSSSDTSNVVSIGSSTNPIGFGTTGGNTFSLDVFASGCTSLNQVYFDSGVKITSLQHAFRNCSGLTTFRNQDSATGFTTITNMSNAFTGCALDADSIENILISCDNGGKSSVVLNINGGSNAAYSTWSGIATQALSNLQGKSWTISYNT